MKKKGHDLPQLVCLFFLLAFAARWSGGPFVAGILKGALYRGFKCSPPNIFAHFTVTQEAAQRSQCDGAQQVSPGVSRWAVAGVLRDFHGAISLLLVTCLQVTMHLGGMYFWLGHPMQFIPIVWVRLFVSIHVPCKTVSARLRGALLHRLPNIGKPTTPLSSQTNYTAYPK